MATKFTRDVSKKDKNGNPYRISDKKSTSARPGEVPLEFRNLKSKTKYKLFVENGPGSLQEDITRFGKPFGKSIIDNNNADSFDEFVSTDSGELFINARPFGTDNVSLTNDDWNKHWQYARRKGKTVDIGRKNFIIVESSQVNGPTTTNKSKEILSQTFPISIDVDKDDQKLQRKTKQQILFNFIQSFYIDPNAVGNAKTVDLTDVTLYFRNKPDRELNTSKRIDPSVTVALIDVEADNPNIEKQYSDSITSVSWSSIQPSSDASVGTQFEFKSPIRLEVGRSYAIAIKFEDKDYVLWTSKRGDVLVNTEQLSPGASKEHRGFLYGRTNTSAILRNKNFDELFTKKTGEDLKFDVHVAEYDTSADVDVQFVNIDQEFLTVSNTTDNWVGSEYVYANTANSTGTISITAGQNRLVGTSTSFTSDLAKDSQIVLIDGSNVQIVTVGDVVNDTLALIKSDVIYTMSGGNYKVTAIGKVDHFDYATKLLYLRESNANASVYFDETDVIIGVESGEQATVDSVGALPVSVFNLDLDLSLPSVFNLNGSYNLSVQDASNGDLYTIDSSNSSLDFFKPNYVREYAGAVASRSLESLNTSTLFDQDEDSGTADAKSLQLNLDFVYQGTGNRSYESPLINVSRSGLSLKQWKINSDATNEHTNSGNAQSKHISTKLTLDEGQEAEDIRVIQNAYRPIGTDIKVYAKILNNEDPDPFEDKNWTELRRTVGENQFSEKDNFEDYREFEYTFPATIPSSSTLNGTVSTLSGNAEITGSGTTFTSDLTVGDIIKIYSPFFENNYGYFSVVTVTDNDTIVVNEPITNADILGSGFKVDKVSTPQTAFLNPLNLNIVRYFGPNGQSYDGYSTVAIKTVLLSNNALITPRVDDSRVISVSA